MDVLLAGEDAVVVDVELVEAFGGSFRVGLTGDVLVAGELAGLFLVEAIELRRALCEGGIRRGGRAGEGGDRGR